jgi:hypothetical protein
MGNSTRYDKVQRPSRITVPERAHPLARLVFGEMQRQNVTYFNLEMDSGVLTSTFKAWRTDNAPGLASIEAALGALGWCLVPVPRMDRLPDDIRDDLKALADEWANREELLGRLMLNLCQPRRIGTRDNPAPNPVVGRTAKSKLAIAA